MAQAEIDSLTFPIDVGAHNWSIEGDEVGILGIKNRPIHTNDYLGVGTRSWKL